MKHLNGGNNRARPDHFPAEICMEIARIDAYLHDVKKIAKFAMHKILFIASALFMKANYRKEQGLIFLT